MSRKPDVVTMHTLTANVPNLYAPFRDKRLRLDWLHKPVVPAGTRFLLRRSWEYEKENLPVETTMLSLYPASHRHFEERVRWWESRLRDDPASMWKQVHEGETEREKELNSRAEAKRAAAYAALAKALIANLSEPIRDFESLFATSGEHEDRVLHRLFLMGAVSLDQIEATIQTLTAEDQAEYDARRAAERAAEKETA